MRSPNVEILADRIAGARAAIERAYERFNYNEQIEGLLPLNRHTLQLKLNPTHPTTLRIHEPQGFRKM